MKSFRRPSAYPLLAVTGALAAALAGGCGGEDAGPRPEANYCREIEPLSDVPDPGSGPVDCAALAGLEIYLLDDFEPGSSRPGWYLNNDRTALMDPLPDTDPVPSTAIPGGRCLNVASDAAPTLCDAPETQRGKCSGEADLASQRAIHIRSGLLTNNGGVFGRNLPKVGCIEPHADNPDTLCPYKPGPPEVGPCSVGDPPSPAFLGCTGAHDYSDWDGVIVWARKAQGSNTGLRVRVSDAATDEASCQCNPFTDQNDTSDGCDKFGAYINLTTDFEAFLVPFEEMQQGGWGKSSPGLDKSSFLSVGLEFGRGSWDIWIDDIGFYRSKP